MELRRPGTRLSHCRPNPTPRPRREGMEPLRRIECEWCQAQSPPGTQTCASCGARLDVRNLVSDSGWREAPRLKDMTEIRFGSSTCQAEGEIVPVADITLGAGNHVYFEQH